LSELNKFISPDLAIAPTFKFNSLNLFLREVKLDYNSSFQVWSPKSNAILLPEEVNLLKSDYVRLASICTRLIKLLGASCSEEEDYLLSSQKIIYEWEDVIYFVSKYGFKPNAIDIMFSPQVFRPIEQGGMKRCSLWAIEPSCWEIFFLELKFCINNGFTAEPRNEFLSVMVWTGRPIVKSIPGI
jgi:hypothetical protein